MEVIALHTRLTPGKEAEYEAVHRVTPLELDGALRRAGVASWRIWRDGHDLFHVVEVADFARMRESLRNDPADAAWQVRIDSLLAQSASYAGPLAEVWTLPPEYPARRSSD